MDIRSARASVIKWYQAALHFSGCLARVMGSLTQNLSFEPVDCESFLFHSVFSLFFSFFLSFFHFFFFSVLCADFSAVKI